MEPKNRHHIGDICIATNGSSITSKSNNVKINGENNGDITFGNKSETYNDVSNTKIQKGGNHSTNNVPEIKTPPPKKLADKLPLLVQMVNFLWNILSWSKTGKKI